MSLPTERCALASLRRADPLSGTASPVERYLLVEHPGPWGPSAHPDADLPPAHGKALREAAARLHARLLLIRRPGRRPAEAVRAWAYADVREGHEELRWGSYPAAELAAALFDPADTVPSDEPAYLVCTQGRHDQCCAVEGRPVAQALQALDPARTWECTHVGGDRFAGNVVLLPHGLAYGRVTADRVREVVDAYAEARVVPALLRGRNAHPPVAQHVAAEIRAATGAEGVGDVRLLRVERTGHDAWVVELGGPGGTTYVADVRETHDAVDTPLTCAGAGPGTQRVFATASLRLSDGLAERALD